MRALPPWLKGSCCRFCPPEAMAPGAAARSGGCSVPVDAVVIEPLPRFAGQAGVRLDLDAGHPHAALRTDMDDAVVAMLEDETLEIRGPPHKNTPATVRADPLLRARFRAAVKNHLVCVSH